MSTLGTTSELALPVAIVETQDIEKLTLPVGGVGEIEAEYDPLFTLKPHKPLASLRQRARAPVRTGIAVNNIDHVVHCYTGHFQIRNELCAPRPRRQGLIQGLIDNLDAGGKHVDTLKGRFVES